MALTMTTRTIDYTSEPLWTSSFPEAIGDEDDAPFICVPCNRGFTHVDDLVAHIKTHSLPDRPEKCPLPGCLYHTQGFEYWHECARHALRHCEMALVCGFCPATTDPSDKVFGRADLFEKHLLSAHDPFLAPYGETSAPCPICGVCVPNAWDLSVHLSYCVIKKLQQLWPPEESSRAGESIDLHESLELHDGLDLHEGSFMDDPAPDTLETSLWPLDAPLIPAETYTATTMEPSASAQPPLKEETSTFTASPDPDVDAASASTDKARPKPSKHPAKWQCHLCPKRYTRALALRAHIDNHNGIRPYPCRTCGLPFTRNHDRKTHEALHEGARAFACDVAGCDKAFARQWNLERHRRNHARKITQGKGNGKGVQGMSESQDAATTLLEIATVDWDLMITDDEMF